MAPVELAPSPHDLAGGEALLECDGPHGRLAGHAGGPRRRARVERPAPMPEPPLTTAVRPADLRGKRVAFSPDLGYARVDGDVFPVFYDIRKA